MWPERKNNLANLLGGSARLDVRIEPLRAFCSKSTMWRQCLTVFVATQAAGIPHFPLSHSHDSTLLMNLRDKGREAGTGEASKTKAKAKERGKKQVSKQTKAKQAEGRGQAGSRGSKQRRQAGREGGRGRDEGRARRKEPTDRQEHKSHNIIEVTLYKTKTAMHKHIQLRSIRAIAVKLNPESSPRTEL